MNLNLKGRKALVCGGSEGIGAGIATALAEEGVKILLVSRSKDKLESLKDSLTGEGHDIFPADLSSDADVQKLVEHIGTAQIDIVINNTGGPAPGPISEASIEAFEKAIKMHLHASHKIMQAALPHMKQQQYGRFINVISTSVKIPIPGLGVSNTTRGAMASWSKTLSSEVAPYGITVNNILPGAIETGRLEAIIKSQAEKAGISEEQSSQRWADSIPAGRFGQPREIGDLAAFLSSEKAAYITGVSIQVDGGRTGAL